MIFSFVNSEIFKITVKVFLHPFAWDSLVLVTKVSAWQGGELRRSRETAPRTVHSSSRESFLTALFLY